MSAVLSGVAVCALLPAHALPLAPSGVAVAQVQSASRQPTETLEAVRSLSNAAELTLRGTKDRLRTLRIGPANRITDAQSVALGLAELRAGDQLLIDSQRNVRDVSQSGRTLRGVVSLVSSEQVGALALQVPHSEDVLIDTTGTTTYTDTSTQTTAVFQIEEGDEVVAVGSFDRAVGEMTQTASISRIPPAPRTPGR